MNVIRALAFVVAALLLVNSDHPLTASALDPITVPQGDNDPWDAPYAAFDVLPLV